MTRDNGELQADAAPSSDEGHEEPSGREAGRDDVLADALVDALDSLLSDCHMDVESERQCFGLTGTQYHALHVIGEDSLPMQELARRMLVSASTATRVTDTLVKQRLVMRATDSADRRNVFVQLSTLGRQHLSEARDARRRNAELVLARVPDPDRDTLVKMLQVLERASRAVREDSNAADPDSGPGSTGSA